MRAIYSARCAVRTTFAVLLLALPPALCGNGVVFVAGKTGFNAGVNGKPITWTNGRVEYFTDHGDLSPLLPQGQANAFVAEAMSRWTSVPTAALTASRGGALDQDVNGSNVFVAQGQVNMPDDIRPTATHKPLGIVYDADGFVTEALLGGGASDPALCVSNGVYGGADAFQPDATFAHALIIINGRCAQTSSHLPALRYRLVRMLGRVLGVGWSQVNDNIRTGIPPPTPADFQGAPVMHPSGLSCGPAVPGGCTSGADNLRLDDRAAISQLYPVTAQNLASFPGKMLFAENTISIRGSIYFSAPSGRGQPMQGVNVVVRMIDPATGLPSRVHTASSVSGFRFRGHAGNPVSGFAPPGGERYDRFGSDRPNLEGYYEISGLELPPGVTAADFQLVLEPVDPLYTGSMAVGPYGISQVPLSGTPTPVIVPGLVIGSTVVLDIIVPQSAPQGRDNLEPNSFRSPATLPESGAWIGSLSGYGDEDYFLLPVRGQRTLDVQVTALNEAFLPAVNKSHPMLGLWLATDAPETLPIASADSFNRGSLGLTQLTVNLDESATLKLGIADLRGDGRPDFLYRARVLYADTVSPERIPAATTAPFVIRGTGFRQGMQVSVGGVLATVLSAQPDRIIAQPPELVEGKKTIEVRDPSRNAVSAMTNALVYGVIDGDKLQNLTVSNPSIPIGSETVNPITVRAVAADLVTPVPGLNVLFSVSPGNSQIAPCGVGVCTFVTDIHGEAAATVTVRTAGLNLVTAALLNNQRVQVAVNGVSSASSVVALAPLRHVLSGSSASLPLTARYLSANNPASGQTLNFTVVNGAGTLAPTSTVTAANGEATTTLSVTNFSATAVVLVCAGAGPPCAQFTIQPVPASLLLLEKYSGDEQLLMPGQSSQPVVVRVTDSLTPRHPMQGVAVGFQWAVYAGSFAAPACNHPEGPCDNVAGKALSTASATLVSGSDGKASLSIPIQASWGACHIVVSATAVGGQTQVHHLRVIAP